jgi:hypothetical protein
MFRMKYMENKPTITLQFLRYDGRHEGTKLTHHNLAEARELAEQVFRKSDGLYTEVAICLENGHVETVQNLHPTLADFSRI